MAPRLCPDEGRQSRGGGNMEECISVAYQGREDDAAEDDAGGVDPKCATGEREALEVLQVQLLRREDRAEQFGGQAFQPSTVLGLDHFTVHLTLDILGWHAGADVCLCVRHHVESRARDEKPPDAPEL